MPRPALTATSAPFIESRPLGWTDICWPSRRNTSPSGDGAGDHESMVAKRLRCFGRALGFQIDRRRRDRLNGVLEDGGMTIFKAADLEEARKSATDDPTVK